DITRQYHLGEAKRDFVANVSHELRTPLTVISGLLEQSVIAEGDANTRKRMTEMMQQQATRMRDLINDLLTLSRLEAKDPSLRDEHVAVPALLEEIVAEAHSLAAGSGHVLQLHIQSSDGLRGNAIELRAAFSNLVTNAIKHTPSRSEVHIRWTVDATGAHLSVRDTGGGIPARHIPRLTERLYRVDASRSRDTGGTGLGLAIVKHALDQHGANLEINSTEGRGSTFTCHFPLVSIIAGGLGEESPVSS
ncbi:MAG: ATP-binding protein, partial [Pseudomonadales bacterium]